MKRKGFTIVELLVVLAVIAVLLSIALPAMHKVKIKGCEAACICNVQEISSALKMYMIDYKDAPPIALNGGWGKALMSGQYVKSESKYKCPLDSRAITFDPQNNVISISYNYNPSNTPSGDPMPLPVKPDNFYENEYDENGSISWAGYDNSHGFSKPLPPLPFCGYYGPAGNAQKQIVGDFNAGGDHGEIFLVLEANGEVVRYKSNGAERPQRM